MFYPILMFVLTLIFCSIFWGEWNEGAAKARLLQMFEAIGLEDPWVAAQRRRLSLVLFG